MVELCDHYGVRVADLVYAHEIRNDCFGLRNWKTKRFKVDASYILMCGGLKPLKSIDRGIKPTRFVINLLKEHEQHCIPLAFEKKFRGSQVDLAKVENYLENNEDAPEALNDLVVCEKVLNNLENRIVQMKTDKKHLKKQKFTEMKKLRGYRAQNAAMLEEEFICKNDKSELFPHLYRAVVNNNKVAVSGPLVEHKKKTFLEVLLTEKIKISCKEYDFVEDIDVMRKNRIAAARAKMANSGMTRLLNTAIQEQQLDIKGKIATESARIEKIKDGWFKSKRQRRRCIYKPEFGDKETRQKESLKLKQEQLIPLKNRYKILDCILEENEKDIEQIDKTDILKKNMDTPQMEFMKREYKRYNVSKRLKKDVKCGLLEKNKIFKGYHINPKCKVSEQSRHVQIRHMRAVEFNKDYKNTQSAVIPYNYEAVNKYQEVLKVYDKKRKKRLLTQEKQRKKIFQDDYKDFVKSYNNLRNYRKAVVNCSEPKELRYQNPLQYSKKFLKFVYKEVDNLHSDRFMSIREGYDVCETSLSSLIEHKVQEVLRRKFKLVQLND